MRLDSAGNLGLGVTPSAWLSTYKAFQIGSVGRSLAQTGSGAGDWTMAFNAIYSTANSRWDYAYTGDAAVRYSQTGSGIHAWFTAPSGTAGNAITFSQAATLTASGNYLLGTTSDLAGTPRLSVSYDQSSGYGITLKNTNSGNSTNFIYFINSANGGAGSISQNGATGVLYNITSDYRLKNIVGPVTNSGVYIDKLNPVQGSWKSDGSRFIGFLAHELQEASETIVGTGVKDGEEMQSIDYSNAELIANLVAELKSLRQRVATLEAQ
jgi:hypothetical protein